MSTRFGGLLLSVALPAVLVAQSTAPVAKAFKDDAAIKERNLVAAAVAMPAADYGFKPTAAQMTFGDAVLHVAEGNDFLCSSIGNMKAPPRPALTAASGKDTLVARLKDTFKFCDDALAGLDDSRLGEPVPFFGGHTVSRADAMTVTTGDWSDHYSQMAIYLRLKGQLPPTAKKP